MRECGNSGCLDKAGDESGSDDHPGEPPQLHRVELETSSEKDHSQAKSAEASRENWVQLVSNVARVAVAWDGFTCLITIREFQILGKVKIVQGVHERGIEAGLGALGSSKLAKVVGDVLQEDPHHQHAKERRQRHSDTRNMAEQISK